MLLSLLANGSSLFRKLLSLFSLLKYSKVEELFFISLNFSRGLISKSSLESILSLVLSILVSIFSFVLSILSLVFLCLFFLLCCLFFPWCCLFLCLFFLLCCLWIFQFFYPPFQDCLQHMALESIFP